MKISAPVYHLKRQAKILSREENLPLHEALDRIAAGEGFVRWSLLASHLSGNSPARKLLARLNPGDLVLLGARPGHGKTQLGLELLIEALNSGHHGIFFTLAYSPIEVLDLFRRIGRDPATFQDHFELDASDSINADRIMTGLTDKPPGTTIVIDYLQLLDQKRENPALMKQIGELKAFAIDRKIVMVFTSQISRSFDLSAKKHPDHEDVRLPNPLDLMLFDKLCFLNDGELRVST